MSHITRQEYDYKNILASKDGSDTRSVILILDASASAETAAGTLLGKITASGKYSEYAAGASDGTETAVGILKTAISQADRIASDRDIAMYYTGRFITAQLVLLDAAALVDLKGRTVEGITYF